MVLVGPGIAQADGRLYYFPFDAGFADVEEFRSYGGFHPDFKRKPKKPGNS
jgi:hypothetical protein